VAFPKVKVELGLLVPIPTFPDVSIANSAVVPVPLANPTTPPKTPALNCALEPTISTYEDVDEEMKSAITPLDETVSFLLGLLFPIPTFPAPVEVSKTLDPPVPNCVIPDDASVPTTSRVVPGLVVPIPTLPLASILKRSTLSV